MTAEQNDLKWDKLLKIRTTGRDDSRADQYRYPYEPTPYSVLERLAVSGYITKKNKLVDYGCGKGRVGFYLSYQTRCRSVGIEYDERIFQDAESNRERSVSGGTGRVTSRRQTRIGFTFLIPFRWSCSERYWGEYGHLTMRTPEKFCCFSIILLMSMWHF